MDTRTLAIMGGATLFAVIGGTWLSTLVFAPPAGDDRFAQCSGTTVAGGSIGGPFELVDENGVTVTDKDVFVAPSIVYFGYTFCPDICPMDNQRNAFAVELLEEQGIIANPVFISIDPERDTVDVVRDYTANFHDRMIGLTGTPEQVAVASRAYRTFYQKRDGSDPAYYMMDHSVFSYLVLPEIGFVDVFGREDTPEAVAERTACYVTAAATN